MAYSPVASTSGSTVNMPSQTITLNEGDISMDPVDGLIFKEHGITRGFSGPFFKQTADKIVTNSASASSIIGTGRGSLTIPSNFWTVGATIYLRTAGVYSTPTLISSNVLSQIKLGSTVLTSITTSSLLTGATNLRFDGEIYITCRAVGASGVLSLHGDIEYAITSTGGVAFDPLNNNGNTISIDLTGPLLLDSLVTWDAASTTRIIKSTICFAEVI